MNYPAELLSTSSKTDLEIVFPHFRLAFRTHIASMNYREIRRELLLAEHGDESIAKKEKEKREPKTTKQQQQHP